MNHHKVNRKVTIDEECKILRHVCSVGLYYYRGIQVQLVNVNLLMLLLPSLQIVLNLY